MTKKDFHLTVKMYTNRTNIPFSFDSKKKKLVSTNNSAILKFGTHFIPQNCKFLQKKFAIPKSEIGKKKLKIF